MGQHVDVDVYEVLGVRDDASAEELRRAYQQLALQHHPDRARNGSAGTDSNEEFQRIQTAWELIRDPTERRRYDAERRSKALYDASIVYRTDEVDLGEMDYTEDDAGEGVWKHACRCGETFVITEQQLCAGIDTISCRSCSLVLRPLYQASPDDAADAER